MKKTLLILLCAMLGMNTMLKAEETKEKGQFIYGVSFDLGYSNKSSENSKTTWRTLLTPNFGYRINEKMETGVNIGFNWERSNITVSNTSLAFTALGWDAAPFFRYALLTFLDGAVKIFVDTHLYVGMDFPLSVHTSQQAPIPIDYDYTSRLYYGVQAAPMLAIRVNKKTTLNIHVAIASLGYSGSTSFRPNGEKVYENNLLVFSGKLQGLVQSALNQGLYSIKFGVTKNF